MATFDYVTDAINAGYVRAHGWREFYRLYRIRSIDVSGGRWFGYNYKERDRLLYEANVALREKRRAKKLLAKYGDALSPKWKQIAECA